MGWIASSPFGEGRCREGDDDVPAACPIEPSRLEGRMQERSVSVVNRGERSTEDNDAVGISHTLYPVVGTRIVCDLPMTRNK